VTALRSSALVAAVLAAACGAASPRFPADVHAALADEPMRRLETESLVVYYPAKRQAEARRLADRAEGCAAELRAKARIKNRYWAEKVTLVVPELPFNNAFVMPAALGPAVIAQVPTSRPSSVCRPTRRTSRVTSWSTTSSSSRSRGYGAPSTGCSAT
jgi:hypothetical protein